MRKLPSASYALRVARGALEAAVRGNTYRLPGDLPTDLTAQRAGAFITLVRNGKLRACWGTLEAQHRHLAEEIVAAAAGVCTRDPRYPPLRPEEVRHLKIILTIVTSPPEPTSPKHICPRKHGVLVRSGERSAVVLPHEGRTVRRMLTMARQKAGIHQGEPIEVYVFRVQTFSE